MGSYFAILCALLSSLFFGASDFCGGYAAKNQATIRVLLYAAPASLLVELIAWPCFGAQFNTQSIIWGSVAGIAYTGGFALLYWALARGPVSIASPISAIISALLPLIIGLLQGESLHISADYGLILAVGAVIMLSLPQKGNAHITLKLGTLLGAILGGAGIGIQLIALNQAPHSSGVAPLIISRVISVLLIWIGFISWQCQQGKIPLPFTPTALSQTENLAHRGYTLGNKSQLWAIASGICDSCASIAFVFAVHLGQLIISAVITALYPAGTIFLAHIILHEKLTRRQFSGLILATLAIILLTVQ